MAVEHAPEQRLRTRVAVRVAVTAGLTGCVVGASNVSTEHVAEPLTIFLIALAVAANLTATRYSRTYTLSGSFACSVFAAVALGTGPGAAVVIGAEAITYAIDRVRPIAEAVNLLATLAPTLAIGLTVDSMQVADKAEAEFAIVLGVLIVGALAINFLLQATLLPLHDGVPLRRGWELARRVAPIFAMTVPLVVGSTVVYAMVGAVGSAAIISAMLTLNYTASLLIEARDQRARAAALAAGRGRLVAQAVAAEERERRLLAERLHDHAMQSLLVAQQDLDDAAEGDPDALGRARDALSGAVGQLRGEVFELHPAVLEQNGLAAAIEAVAEKEGRRGGFAAKVSVDPEAAGLNDRLLFALARELLVNAARHAEASLVTVSITRVADDLVVEVCDDGSGIPAGRVERAVSEGHIGLASSRERVDALGGSFALDSAPGEGTTVRVSIPARAELPEPKLNERPMDGPGTVLAERKGQPRPV